MIQVSSILHFPLRHSTTTMLFGAATNLSMVIAAIAIQQFALMAICALNICLFTLGAYLAHKYTVLQLNVTPVHAYGPLTTVTVDSYSVTNERIPTPAPTAAPLLLSSSMVAPLLQQAAQTGPANNPATSEVIAKP